AGFGVAGEIRLPGRLAGRARQAAYVEDELADLLFLEGFAEFFHGRRGHAVADDAGDVVVASAVNPAVVSQVRPLAARAVAAVPPAAQAAEQRLAFLQGRLLLRRQLARGAGSVSPLSFALLRGLTPSAHGRRGTTEQHRAKYTPGKPAIARRNDGHV